MSSNNEYTGWPKKRPELCVTITTRILYGAKFPFGTFVDQYVLLLNYKFQ